MVLIIFNTIFVAVPLFILVEPVIISDPTLILKILSIYLISSISLNVINIMKHYDENNNKFKITDRNILI